MAYPEPTPVIKRKDSEKFRERLRDFKLSESQRRYYREAFAAFKHSEKSPAKKRKL